jgi:KDO2-lipid IV(A) lauroyltransferase
MGAWIGTLLWWIAAKRRHIVLTNLSLCFPQLDPEKRVALAKQTFVLVAQALLDRSWLWHSNAKTLSKRLTLAGDKEALELLQAKADTPNSTKHQPLVLFAPHFVGLDAGWTALSLNSSRELSTIFTQQSSKVMDDWVYAGRSRLGKVKLFRKVQGVSDIIKSLNKGAALYLLPDMDFGEKDTVFVPFFGQSASTVTSLSRFAKISKAKVMSVTTELTKTGYSVRVSPLWLDFPSADPVADTARMNVELEKLICPMVEQYYWVHRRFKTRPPGESGVY